MLDTSMMTPEVHRRTAAGETAEQIAATYTAQGKPTTADAVRQYLAAVDENGLSRKKPPRKARS